MKIPFTTTDTPLRFTPKILSTGADSDPHFLVKPMTQGDFDQLGYELFRHNIHPITQETFRAAIIDEFYERYGEVDGEDRANLMDEFWQADDVHSASLEEWRQRENARLWDISQGAPARDQEPLPQHPMPMRRRNRAQLVSEQLKNDSRRIRDLTIEMQSYEPRQKEGCMRLVLLGWSGFATPHVREDGIVPEETFRALKAEVGKEVLAELYIFAMSQNSVSLEEMGNSDLPVESKPDQSGLPAPSGASDSSDGNSTSGEDIALSSSLTGLTPVDVSAETTDSLSTSTSASTGANQSNVTIQTDED